MHPKHHGLGCSLPPGTARAWRGVLSGAGEGKP
jgi:hypothetical protein